ncbi:hypothetical protein V7S43_006197 [Phytophthora oleae]|uniref:RxLR effector protein n=1 Tax=Phytophthora oleae TaxID=2107226 RepID=A0ABD3FQB4_9STRA
MKTFFLVLASILVSLTMANHMPGHMSPRKHAKHPKVVEGENRMLQGDLGGGDDVGDDDNQGDGDDMGGLGGGLAGGLGGGLAGGLGGGLGGVGGGGAGGYRALRGDELVDANPDLGGDDEVVVAGRTTVVRGGAVVARPGPRRRWY